MGISVMLPTGFGEHDFIKLIKEEKNKRNCIRLLAMHHIQKGKSLGEVTEIVQHHYQTVSKWLKRFRDNGFDGLLESPRCGAPKTLTTEQESWLYEKVKSLSESKTGGYITGLEIQLLLEKEFSVNCSLKTVYNILHRLNLSWISARSAHPKSNKKVQEAYKKTLVQ